MSSSASSSFYASMRASVDNTSNATESRVQVNQRALIDKILARYASAGAVYRELLQNSNDAEATTAEICFTTISAATNGKAAANGKTNVVAASSNSKSNTVTQVVYRNNGMPFREEDWDRLKDIAAGNPDPSKVGAFGVGAYTMFSICEEPLVISGKHALCFFWKGDALWTRMADASTHASTINNADNSQWTSFVLPSRDKYGLPNMEEFGEFLCASLTFTKHLKLIRVLVNDVERLCIVKTLVQEPRLIAAPKTSSNTVSSWFSRRNDDAVTSTGLFTLASNSIMEFVYRITVTHTPGSSSRKIGESASTSSLDARYISATATTHIKADMAKRMERVTKKQPPSSLTVQLFLNADGTPPTGKDVSVADRITQSFSPQPGKGRIFIGFRTSQTTGLGAHVAAPFVPTVEREAMDLQDASLRSFNSELLEFAGMLMRFTLEDTMFNMIDAAWQQNKAQRVMMQASLRKEQASTGKASLVKASMSAHQNEAKEDNEFDGDVAAEPASLAGSGIMGFAKFMARGVKKKIVSVVNTVEDMLIDDAAEYLKPIDAAPIFEEEKQAVVLMRAFCPEQSTPDATVGMCIAEGFSKCVPDVPPVLTTSGVVKGNQARLPNKGIESFVEEGVVRRVVYVNAQEYHTVIANVRELQLDDLLHSLYSSTLEKDKLVFFLKWWSKYARADLRGAQNYGLVIKDAVKYFPVDSSTTEAERSAIRLKDILFYVEKGSALSKQGLPLPESAIDPALAKALGESVLTDSSMREWFSPLPIEVWASFVAELPLMSNEDPKDDQLRIDIMCVLCKEYSSRSVTEKITFGSFLASLFGNRKCLSFDDASSSERGSVAVPSDLYIFSAELEAFEAIGTFYKVSDKLKVAGISEDFLLAIGVRKSVSIDFLFASLETLRWSRDPKPLIEYLRSATLTQKDLRKLQQTKYLPSATAGNETFTPSQLFLPNLELRMFPFVRVLQWPSEEELSERSENGAFLMKLGMNTMPSLLTILDYASSQKLDEEARIKVLDFIAARLGPGGIYQAQYTRMDVKTKAGCRILPCVVKKTFGDVSDYMSELHSPLTCYSVPACIDIGVPVLDPALGDRATHFASVFHCPSEPEADVVLERFVQFVDVAQQLQRKGGSDAERKLLSDKIEGQVSVWYQYLSHRASDFGKGALDALRKRDIVSCRANDFIGWFRADQVFFRKDDGQGYSITEELFHIVAFNPFLATLGVKQEASTTDLFQLVLANPQRVLDTLGSEEKYRLLLRRIASNPPFAHVTPVIRDSPFLLAKAAENINGSATPPATKQRNYQLLKASEIYIIDNTFLARMFPVARAPAETDLEEFYSLLGSQFISTAVERKFEIVGRPSKDTNITKTLKERVFARGPLLVSPSMTTRPLVPRAEYILNEKRFEVYEAPSLLAVYALNGIVRRKPTTCFSKPSSAFGIDGNAIYVCKDYDWFDVGYAIGDLIFKRCQLEDAFFISSLLEAPIEQLAARGFPVERILKIESPVRPAARSLAPPTVKPIAPPTAFPIPPASQPTPTMAEIPSTPSDTVSKSKRPYSPNSEQVLKEEMAKSHGEEFDLKSDPPSGGFTEQLSQMFPDIDKDYLLNRLGPDPTMDEVNRFAEELASDNYLRNDSASESGTVASSTTARDQTDDAMNQGSRKGLLRQKLGKAFRSRLPKGLQGSAGGNTISGPAGNDARPHHEHQKPVPHVVDAKSHENLGRMLQNAINSSSQVNIDGFHSHDQQLTSIPQGLDRGETCELVPGHSIKPYSGPRGTGMTANGIRIFSARESMESESFLLTNDGAIESFGVVLERLCGIFGLSRTSVAIFHDPTGGTIAFNAGKAVHCNIRFFYSLFYSKNLQTSKDCYSYWFVTFAHELAHHFVSAHNKEHGFYTESFVSTYLPKLITLLASLGEVDA
ncbi:hypothetical protein MPSEU_000264800 [Mayamaea pseudoterrestris]|nr:hypothetical protein MPSEU_000264800 [Mayamaea pseudoterrestris]